MKLHFDFEDGLYYWIRFSDANYSQGFFSKSEAISAREKNEIIWTL